MATYVGIVTAADGPVGRMKISLGSPDNGRRIVTGNLKVGANPTALTGFSGDWSTDGSFQAAGANKVTLNPQDPLDDILLGVDIAGTKMGTTVIGTILGTVNQRQAKWTFEAYDINKDERGKRMLAQITANQTHADRGPLTGITVNGATSAKKGASGIWDRIPTVGKVLGGIVFLSGLGIAGKKLNDMR